jgi:hypothetical protein
MEVFRRVGSLGAKRKVLFICSALVFALPFVACAWDEPAHEIVATIALDRMNPKARAAVAECAREISSPGHAYDSVSIACWMDDIRRDSEMPFHGKFLSWHYIDIGIDPSDPVQSLEPGDDNDIHGNIVQALKRAMVVLKGGTDPYIPNKAVACALVVHLVGDIHQPLHCATDYFVSGGQMRQDRGGNTELVDNHLADDPKLNLHGFWDSAWRASFDDYTGCVVIDRRYNEKGAHDPLSVLALAKDLEVHATGSDEEPVDIDKWARESNGIAKDFVYREITATDSRKYCRLGSGYVAKAQELARRRLVLAAERLAVLMNETVGADAPENPPPSYPAGPPSTSY